MKKHLLKTVLLAVGLLLGTTSTWAETITTMGNKDKGWTEAGSNVSYTLAANQTLKVNFTVEKVKGEAVTNGHFIRVRQNDADVMMFQSNGGFYYGGNINAWWSWTTNAHFSCSWWTQELGYGDFMTSDVITGAKVELTLQRRGTQLYYSARLDTENNGIQYVRYVSGENIFDADADVVVDLGADYAVLTNVTDISSVGASIGNLQNGIWDNNYQGFTLGANSSITFSFKQFTPMTDWANGAQLEVLIDPVTGDRWGWAGIRPDRWGWAGGNVPDFTQDIDNYFTINSSVGEFFDDFPAALNDAEVTMTIARTGNVFSVTSVTTCISGEVKTQTFSYENEVFGSDDYVVTTNLRAEKALLCLYPYELNVSANNDTYGTVEAGVAYPGQEVTVTATPNAGYKFVNWTEGENEVSTDAAYTFTALADRTLVANFEAVPTYSYTVNAVDGNDNILKQLATGSDNKGASIAQKYPQFVLVGSTLYEAAKINNAYSKTFTLSSDEQVEAIAYTAATIDNVLFYAEGEDVISGATADIAAASNGKIGGRSVSSADWKTLPAGSYTVHTRLNVGNSGTHTLNIKVGGDVKASVERAASSGWYTAENQITLETAGTLSTEFNGGSSTGIDWLYITGAPANEVVGATDCSTPYATTWNTTPLWINAGETAKYSFVNHNSGMGAGWNNWNLWAANAESVNKTVIRADGYAVIPEAYNGWKSIPTYSHDIVTDLNGATVELTVSLADAGDNTYTLTATATSEAYEGSLVYEQTGITDSKMKVYLSVDNSWLEILSEKVGVSMNAYGWATFASDNALDFSNTGLTAYAISSTAGDITVKNEVATTTAGKGLLVSGVEGNYLVPVIAPANVDNIDANTLESTLLVRGTGANVEEGTDKANYVLSVYKNSAMFKKIESEPAFVPVNKAYLVLANGINAAPKYISIVGGEATGIDNLNVDEENAQADGAIYNLAGQRVSKDYKGLVILNGKKVIIK